MPKDCGIGASPKRREDIRFLTGLGQYTDDISLTGETHAVFARSQVANGIIKSIDTSAAENMPGVLAVFTGDDFVDVGGNPAGWLINSRDGEPMKEPKRPVLAHGKVRHVGDAYAAVIAETAAHLTIFQRTANYSVPARNAFWDRTYTDWVSKHYNELKALVKSTPNGHPFRISSNLAMELSDAERAEMFERAWEKGGLRFRGVFHDLMTSSQANNTAAEFIKSKIRQTVKNPEIAQILSDIDHPYAAKRPPIDTNYFETFNRQNVTLVDLKADPISKIIPSGVMLKSGVKHGLDTLVFATGFDAMTGPLIRLNINGPIGSLKDYWSAGPLSYLGLAIPNFPNLFTVTGPGSPSVLSNMPVSIEQHVDWITNCLQYMTENQFNLIEPTHEAEKNWMHHVNEVAEDTLYVHSDSWYMGANIPGKPRVFMPYVGGADKYRNICEHVSQNKYYGFSLSN